MGGKLKKKLKKAALRRKKLTQPKLRLEKPCDSCGGLIRECNGELRCWTCKNLYDSAGNLLISAKNKSAKYSVEHFSKFVLWVICTFFVPGSLLMLLGKSELIPEAYEAWGLWGFGIWIVAGIVYGAKHDLIPDEAGSGD